MEQQGKSQNPGALAGVTVIDLSRLLPGPFCSMILADHGARVVAVEDKRFAEEDFFLDTVNRNKAHMTLNLKSSEGRDIFYRLVRKADVVIEGFRPGVVERLGVDYAKLRAIKSDIVYCALTGYGQTGPLRDRAGHDVNYLAHSGVLDLIGPPDRPPAIPGIQIADVAGGALNAAVGILMALLVREKTGRGQYIDISITDGSLNLLALQLELMQRHQRPPQRSNNWLSHRYACYNTYATRDGRAIALGAIESRFWKQLCRFFNRPEYISLQYDERRQAEITTWLRRRFAEKTLAQWETELAEVDCCWSPVRTMTEVLADPLFKARQMIVSLSMPAGKPQRMFATPIKLSRTPAARPTPPPAFGQDTEAILTELGYPGDDIQRLRREDII